MAFKGPEPAKIRAMSTKDQRVLYENCSNHPDGLAITKWMDENGLKPEEKLMSFTNPIYRKMAKIAKSSEGKVAMEQAAAKGEPAICGLDRLLKHHLGSDYSNKKTPGTTMSAGSLVDEILPKLGYIKAGYGKCPEECVAGEGIIWAKD